MRFLVLFLSVINFAFASCPTNELVGSFAIGDAPALICVDYLSTKCTAKCGQTTGGTCAMVDGKWGPFGLTGESCVDTGGGDSGGTGGTGGTGSVDCTLTPSDPSCTSGGGSTGGGSSGVVDTGAASCGSGAGCTFNPKGYLQTASNPSDYGLQQIHNVLNSLTTVTTFSSNAANKSLSEIATSLNTFSNAYQNNLIPSNNESIKTNEHLSNIEWRLNNPLSNSSSSASGTSLDYSSKLDALIDLSSYQTNFLASIQGGFYSLSDHAARTSSNTGALFNSYKTYSEINTKQLDDIKSLLAQSVSSGSGTGSGSSVGTSDNPSHVADSSYIRCSDCAFDIAGANQRLETEKANLSKKMDEIKTQAGDIFSFNLNGSADISDCYDILPSWVGDSVCVNTGSLWSILGSIIFIICVMVSLYIIMGD